MIRSIAAACRALDAVRHAGTSATKFPYLRSVLRRPGIRCVNSFLTNSSCSKSRHSGRVCGSVISLSESLQTSKLSQATRGAKPRPATFVGCSGAPNQALQRTGSVCGFTLLPWFQLRRGSGRPLNASSLGRTNRAVGLRSSARWRASPPAAARRARRSVRCVGCRRLQLASALVQSARCSSAACGLTRRCSGPAGCAGSQCSSCSRPAVSSAGR